MAHGNPLGIRVDLLRQTGQFARNDALDNIYFPSVSLDPMSRCVLLICGKAALTEKVTVYLHVVCEYADQVYVEFVTAYVPDDLEWEKPPFRRRGLDKKK